MDCNFVCELPIFAFYFFQFQRSVLVKEFIDGQISASDSDVDFVLVDSHVDPSAAKLVHTFAFPKEHYFELLPVWVVIYVLCQSIVDVVVFDWNVHRNSSLQVDYVLL